MKAGIAYTDWRLMTRWQRADLLARTQLDLYRRQRASRRGLAHMLGAVVEKLLGF